MINSIQPTPPREGLRRLLRRRLSATLGPFARPALLAVASCLGPLAPASSQTTPDRLAPQFRTASRPLIRDRVDLNDHRPIPGAVHPATARAQDLGPVDDTLPLEHIQLALRRPPERQAALDALVQAQSDPASPSFHHWLTPAQVGSEFGPAASDLASLTAFLEAQGFTVNPAPSSQMWLDFTGSAAAVAGSFHTSLHRFRLPSGDVYTSAAQAAELPAALLPAVSGLVSLGNFPFHPQHHPVPAYATANGQSVGVQDFYTIYNELPLLTAASPITGAGQTIALLEDTDIHPADVTQFRALFGVSPATPSLTVQHGSASSPCADPGFTSTDEESEAILDTEWAGAVAPGAALLVMSCASTQSTDGVVLSAESVINDNLAGILSLSYGGTEQGQASLAAFLANLYQQAAAQGQTVVVSTGDSGSDAGSDGLSVSRYGLNVNVLGSSAYNIAAGGTDFQDLYNQTIDGGTSFGVSAFWNPANGPGDRTARSYIPETTWNDTCASSLLNAANEGRSAGPLALCEDPYQRGDYLAPTGGSGGQSILNARPAWQAGTVYGLPSTSAYSGRLLPDLSLFASAGTWGHALSFFQSDVSPSLAGAGGTSFVAPQLAGVFALIAQKTQARIGLANVELYTLAGQQFGTTSYTGSACNGSGASGIGETSALPASSCLFYDIQTGNNAVACRRGTPNCVTEPGQTYGLLSTSTSSPVPAYPGSEGFDMATGIGSLNIQNLVNSWTSPPTPTSTSLTLSPTTFPLNAAFPFTIAISSTGSTGTPTGQVELLTGSIPLTSGPLTLSNGSVTSSTNKLPGGTYTISAKYLGDSHFAISTSPSIAVTVTPQATATALTVTPGSGSVYASTVTLAATLSPASAGIFTASGAISFSDGASAVCSAVPVNPSTGVATCTSPTLSVGTHTFTATYAGDTNFAPSTSLATPIPVAKATPTLTLSNASINYGALSTTLNASVAFAPGAPPTGSLTFIVDTGPALTATCTGATSPLACTASFSSATLPAEAHTLSATLAGDPNYTSASSTATLSVAGAPPAITFAVPARVYGSAPFSLAATSTSPGAFTYTVLSGPALITGSTVTVTGIGPVVLAAAQAAAGTYAAATQTTTFPVAAAAAVWLANANSTLSTFSLTGAALSPSTGFSDAVPGTSGLAFDASGTLWIANSASGVSQFSSAGTPLTAAPYTAGGIHTPLALAVDGAGQIWIANGNGSVTALTNAGAALSPPTGFLAAGLSTPAGIAVDLSGNVWVANTSDNSVTELLGVAAPVAPLATALATGTTGARP